MKAAVWPIDHTRDVTVLHRIEMDVVDVTFEISIIANGMLPVASLPDTLFPLRDFALRSWPRAKTVGKAALDEAPARGEIRVVLGQRPQRVNMVR